MPSSRTSQEAMNAYETLVKSPVTSLARVDRPFSPRGPIGIGPFFPAPTFFLSSLWPRGSINRRRSAEKAFQHIPMTKVPLRSYTPSSEVLRRDPLSAHRSPFSVHRLNPRDMRVLHAPGKGFKKFCARPFKGPLFLFFPLVVFDNTFEWKAALESDDDREGGEGVREKSFTAENFLRNVHLHLAIEPAPSAWRRKGWALLGPPFPSPHLRHRRSGPGRACAPVVSGCCQTVCLMVSRYHLSQSIDCLSRCGGARGE